MRIRLSIQFTIKSEKPKIRREKTNMFSQCPCQNVRHDFELKIPCTNVTSQEICPFNQLMCKHCYLRQQMSSCKTWFQLMLCTLHFAKQNGYLTKKNCLGHIKVVSSFVCLFVY